MRWMRVRILRLGRVVLGGVLLGAVLLGCTAWGTAASAATKAKAPKVTKQPAGVVVEAGQNAVFEAAASGTPTPSQRWEVSLNGGGSWSVLAGASSNTLLITSAQTSESGDEFRSVFTNTAGSATSTAATLIVRRAPAVTLQPMSTTVEEAQGATFEAAASGFPGPAVQWEVLAVGGKWAPIAGATSGELTIASAKTSENARQYRAVFTNGAGKATSAVATLTVQKAPAVTRQPASRMVEAGQAATFEASASGFPTPSVQWEVSSDDGVTWAVVEGATAGQLTLAGTTTAQSGYEYRAVFTNAAGTVTSQAATLTVQSAPVITEQPLNTTVEEGQDAVFEATASGFPAPSVQWEVSSGGGAWSPMEGATGVQLTVSEAKTADNGHRFRAVFTNVAGTVTTEEVTLTVATHHYQAFAWGANAAGELGDGTGVESTVPVPVSALSFVTSVAAGERHSLALLSDGTVMAWGAGASGQLGDGEEAGSFEPVAVEELAGVKAIAAGEAHSLALLNDGTVMAWGANEAGQLGDGNTNESDVPVPVKGLADVVAIAASGEHSLALLGNGTVMAWGANQLGQLGDGKTTQSDVPVAVQGLTGVRAIATGWEFGLALRSNGTVVAWGSDEYGQLGSQTEEETELEEGISTVPVPVNGLSGVTAIASGARHSIALLADGSAMAWGADGLGQLGDGAVAASHASPVAVSGLSGVSAIAAGGEHSIALLGGGEVMTWGDDRRGELGNGSTREYSDVPVAVNGLGEVAGIAAGGMHDLAYGEPVPAVTEVSPSLGRTAGGTSVSITGVNLTDASSVRFGAHPASSFTVNSSSSITAVAPAGAVGTVDVTVTTAAGTSPTGPADRFTYQSAPTVSKLSVKGGSASGATTVTITGANLNGASAVSFGANSATSFHVNSPTSITAVSPPAIAGTVDVRVTTVVGVSARSKRDRFAYAPKIEGITPAAGSVEGGTIVTIDGAGFAPGAATSFEFAAKKATLVHCTSSTTCTAKTPSHPAGSVNVIAVVAKLKSPVSAPADVFTYSAG
jgi:alpha-tubulin suppressor-like RCC1 family protein